jgi:hypothetical protein
VSETEPPRDAAVEEANSQLSEGLKSCRAVVSTYRALLSPEQNADALDDKDSESNLDRPDDNSDE